MMLYKNTKPMICSPNDDTNFFDIIAGVLQGDTLAPYLFILFQDYVLQTSIDLIKENGFTLKKDAETMTNANYTDDTVLRKNTPAQAESLLHSMWKVIGGIDLYENANKTEFMCFKQKGAISALCSELLKLVNL